MEKPNHGEILERLYTSALQATTDNDFSTPLPKEVAAHIHTLVEKDEANKAPLTVAITLFTHKIYDPQQDIRRHQASMKGGFAGRGRDTQYVTPFMKKKGFPAMAETGWLTRSLEQPAPYDLEYPGKITPRAVKTAFLQLIDAVQTKGVSANQVLLYTLKLLIKQRDGKKITLAKPHNLSITSIIRILQQHFDYKYSCHGASRLPTLAVYAAYLCMMDEVARYHDKILSPLEPHTSADSRSGQIGDIQINNANGTAFEGVEIKHGIAITPALVKHAYTKFMMHRTSRYYLLTTANMDAANWDGINTEIDIIRKNHGCQVIVNGVYSSLKYYLRLLNDPADFIDHYVELLKTDEAVKYPHQTVWNEIIGNSHF